VTDTASAVEDAAWAVLCAARALVHGTRAGEDPIPLDNDLIAAVDTLDALLTFPEMDEDNVPWCDVLAGDEVQLKDGTWIPVIQRWTRRNGVEVCVLLPGAEPVDEPRRKSFLMPFTREVRRRPGTDTATIQALKAALDARVISSGATW
jgi:hypothetical protein